MFSTVETDYIQALVNTYKNKGYKYYLAHTITEDGNEYDVCIYFSKNRIDAINDNYFNVENGIKILIDSSSKSNYNISTRDTVSNYNGSVTVDVAEFIYTNAISEYSYTSIPINPDITIDLKENKSISLLIILVSIMLLYLFIRDIFRIGGK